MSLGVRVCTSDWRTTTLTASMAPKTMSAAIDTASEADSENVMIATPNAAVEANSFCPTQTSLPGPQPPPTIAVASWRRGGCARSRCLIQTRTPQLETDCVAGHRGLELRRAK
jgi:hypothetical protein